LRVPATALSRKWAAAGATSSSVRVIATFFMVSLAHLRVGITKLLQRSNFLQTPVIGTTSSLASRSHVAYAQNHKLTPRTVWDSAAFPGVPERSGRRETRALETSENVSVIVIPRHVRVPEVREDSTAPERACRTGQGTQDKPRFILVNFAPSPGDALRIA